MDTTKSLVLRIRESNLECLHTQGSLRWFLPIDSIVLIAEYTTDEGPYVDDYFLVFVTLEHATLYFSTCSFYATGRDEVLATLQERLASPVQLELTASAEWKSRVVWPDKMAGKDYFVFNAVPSQTFTEKIKKRLLGETYEYSISNEVQEYLKVRLRAASV